MIKKFFRWLLNKNELEGIRKELSLLRLLIQNEIERQQPKRHQPIRPIAPVKNR